MYIYYYYYYYCVNMKFKDYVIFLKKTMGSLLKKRNEDVGNSLLVIDLNSSYVKLFPL